MVMKMIKAFLYEGVHATDVMSAIHGISTIEWFLYVPEFNLYFCNNKLTICDDDGLACWELGKNQKEVFLSKQDIKKIKQLIKVNEEAEKLSVDIQQIIDDNKE